MKKTIVSLVIFCTILLCAGCGTASNKKEHDENLKLLEENVDSADEALIEGKAFIGKNELEKALVSFQKSNSGEAKFYAAATLGELNRKDEAKAAFEQCVSENIFAAESLYNLAMIAYEEQNLPMAKSYVEEALKRDPKHLASLFFYGNLFYSESKMDEALEYYGRAAALDPKSKEIQNAIFLVYLQTEKYKEAWDLREKLDKDAPEIAFAVMQLAEITGNFADGANYAKTELLSLPNIRNLAKVLFTKGGNFKKALELAQAEEIAKGKYSVLDRSTDPENAYVFGLNSEKKLFFACSKDPQNLYSIEVSEEGIKLSAESDATVPSDKISEKLSEMCSKK